MTTPSSIRRYALLGWPVRHSLSPPMQEAGFAALGIAATYGLIEVAPADLAGRVDALRRAIGERARDAAPEGAELVAERHLSLARDAAASLRQAAGAIEAGAPLDVAAIDLWEALRSLREVTGEDASERVLDAIFSTFCVGK